MTCLIDDKRWPLLDVTWTGVTTDDEFRAYLDDMDTNLARTMRAGTRTAVLLDARAAVASGSVQRKLQAEWMKANEAECRRFCVGFAFVFDSAIVRGALTAILWLSPLPAPHLVCSTRAEAEDWLTARLRESGVELPGAAISLR